MNKKLGLIATAVAVLAMGAGAAQAQEKVKIGFITDMSSVYSDTDGKGGAVAIQMAIDDFGGTVFDKPVELLFADHQNKADIAATKVREWIDTSGVTAVFGGTNSAAALAIAKVTGDKKRVYINNGAATSALTNEQCGPYTIHYTYDSVALAKGTGSAVMDSGGKSWYFLTADYALGQALESDTASVIKAKGGKIVGTTRHPINASDFSSFLLQAQNAKAQVLALANAGGDTISSIKAAKEFGIDKSMKIVGLLVNIADVHSLGLRNAQGLLYTTSWYWDKDEESRKFAYRYFAKTKRMPTELQAGDYSSAMTYLRAVAALKSTDSTKVMDYLKKTPISDFFAKGGVIRPDGRMVHEMYLVEVKTQSESKKPWDYLKVLKTLPGDQVFTTKAETKCALWK